jgi:hypothetical protein
MNGLTEWVKILPRIAVLGGMEKMSSEEANRFYDGIGNSSLEWKITA